ncbi:MAG: FG-GAP-like repeat-containing protein [Bacteroidota bacterium]
MKRINYLSAIVLILSGNTLFGQGGFTKVVDPGNPVTTFTSPGAYKGAAWVDYDNDGDLDLFASPNFLFRNDGNGVFVQLTNPFGFTALQNPGGSSWADLNHDGFIDCIIAQKPSGVYLNNGNGTFTNISSQISNFNTFPAWACAIGDWNKDAFPDFVFAHAAGFLTPGPFPSKLYLNTNAAVTPQYITGITLTDSTKPYTVPYWSDYDLDGDMDLFVASGPGGSPGPDFCYKNLKVETGLDSLQPMTSELFVQQLQDGQCYNFVDYDNDGDMDLCLTNYSGAQTRFYINSGGVYTLQTMPFTAQTGNLTNDWADFDNDGDIDVLITNDQQLTKYYRNNGNGTFATAISLGIAGGCGITNGDYDNDGDLDLFIHGTGNARALFRNDSVYNNNWVNIKCTGITSNTSAIGTIVKLKVTINGSAVWQLREINAQNSFQSQNDLRVHFGLGNATVIDSIIIKYSSGQIATLTNIAVNNFYCHEEGTNSLCLATGIKEMKNNSSDLSIYPNPSDSFINTKSKNNSKIDYWQIFDSTGKIISFGKNLKIDVSKMTPGNYFLRIISDKKINTFPFIKN